MAGFQSPNFDNIPVELIPLGWGLWNGEPRANQPGKFDKAPVSPITGRKIATSNRSAWGTYADIVSAWKCGRWDGIGVLMESSSGIVGIDIDNVGELKNAGSGLGSIIKRANKAGCYIELSPSGKGLRIFGYGTLPGNRGRRKGQLEIYNDVRFLTVTGHGRGTILDSQWLIDELLALIGGTSQPSVVVTPAISATPDATMVGDLIEWASRKHSRLWEGRWNERDGDLDCVPIYPSQSEADMAIVGHIVREGHRRGITGADQLAATAISVFEASGLYRPEKRNTVERYAIAKAIAGLTLPIPGEPDASDAVAGERTEGDIKAARIFASQLRRKLLYVGGAGRWMRWDEVRWCWCDKGEEMQAAKNIAADVLNSASRKFAEDSDRHKRLMDFAMRLHTRPRLEAMIELAKSEPDMTIGHVTDLDSDPWLVGVRNGVLNLKNGTLLSPDPAMRISRQVAASYFREAPCPEWLRFLDQVFQGDIETIAFIQRALGYTLTGITTEEVLFICYGHGANGKSVFANVVNAILGDYAQAAPPSLLTVRRDGDSGPRNDIARLCGARLVSINELNQGDRLDEQVVKMLAGRETMSARFLHREFFDFIPTAKPWLRTNHRPVITGEDDGIWRRILLIPFHRKFAEGERDKWLESRLHQERDGILAWMVEGCLSWKRDGLLLSPLIRRESGCYRKDSDLLGEFLDEHTEFGPGRRVEQQHLYRAYRIWCDSSGVRAGSKASFTRKLSERGVTEARSGLLRYYTGISTRQATE